MGLFPLPLFVCPEEDGMTWEVRDHEFAYVCDDGALIEVPVGFVTDFASIPREFWDIYPPWGKYGKAAVLHDWLYSTQTTTKERADLILLEAMKACGVCEFTRFVIWKAVEKFGQRAWDSHTRELENQKSTS